MRLRGFSSEHIRQHLEAKKMKTARISQVMKVQQPLASVKAEVADGEGQVLMDVDVSTDGVKVGSGLPFYRRGAAVKQIRFQ